VWQVAQTNDHANPGHVIKQYHGGRTVGEHEVAGLKAAGQYVAHDNNHIVMKHIEGPTLAHIAGGIKDHTQRGEYVNSMKPHVAAKAAEYAKNNGILHGDINMNNVVVHPKTGKVDFVDWEHHSTPTNDPHKAFTTDANKIHSTLNTVWDSTQTPPH
jgi:RIO-like serine/threonine protein kinase